MSYDQCGEINICCSLQLWYICVEYIYYVESGNFFMLLVYTCCCLLPEMLQGAFWIYETEPVELPTKSNEHV